MYTKVTFDFQKAQCIQALFPLIIQWSHLMVSIHNENGNIENGLSMIVKKLIGDAVMN
jgi:hypothetical protein